MDTKEEDDKTTEEVTKVEEPITGDNVTEMEIVVEVEEAGVKEMGNTTTGGHTKTIHIQVLKIEI